ncbi:MULTISPECIES: Imm21 family immunity protein [unclassified Chelatococcus]|uniref:Imm21 family immunity protein n=1 Tax=unclassified Chelatococcus TaxID=2638111 RepID=UPI001BCF72C6|nr:MULTISPECIES: Imm21 family immunity protein [unclassified Chelatococcus]MBS7700269.1 hypothetical protein [Chelatococcus sp. YT9]MBX3558240.1 hypothetical protein [Chelatococcus sp.]
MLEWIVSGGGPLLCIPVGLAPLWKGISGNSSHATDTHEINDYERACRIKDFVGDVEVDTGKALVLGDEPLETAICKLASQEIVIIRMYYCENNVDYSCLIEFISRMDFSSPLEKFEYSHPGGKLLIFDSAYAGASSDLKFIDFWLGAGRFNIGTQVAQPDEETKALVHKFTKSV